MKAIILIALILVSAQAAQKCNQFSAVANIIKTNLLQDLVKTDPQGAQFNQKVVDFYAEVLNGADGVVPTVDIADMAYFKDFKVDGVRTKVCLNIDATKYPKPLDDVFKPIVAEYIESIKSWGSKMQRALAVVQTMLTKTDDDACKVKSGATTKNIRVWAKGYTYKVGETSKTGTDLINMIYKAKIVANIAQIKLFRSILATIFIGDDSVDFYTNTKFQVRKSVYDAYVTANKDGATLFKDNEKNVVDMIKKYIADFGTTECTGDTFQGKIITKIDTYIKMICGDTKDACDKIAAEFQIDTYHKTFSENGADFNDIAGDQASKQTIEPSGRRILANENYIASGDETKGVPSVVDATLDAIKIGGVDASGACVEGDNCKLITSETVTPTASSTTETTNSVILSSVFAIVAILAF